MWALPLHSFQMRWDIARHHNLIEDQFSSQLYLILFPCLPKKEARIWQCKFPVNVEKNKIAWEDERTGTGMREVIETGWVSPTVHKTSHQLFSCKRQKTQFKFLKQMASMSHMISSQESWIYLNKSRNRTVIHLCCLRSQLGCSFLGLLAHFQSKAQRKTKLTQ